MFQRHAADAGDVRVIVEEPDCLSEKIRAHPHVAIDQAEIASPAVLISELRTGAAGSVFDPRHAHDLDPIALRYLAGPVGRGAIGQDDFAIDALESRKRALDGS